MRSLLSYVKQTDNPLTFFFVFIKYTCILIIQKQIKNFIYCINEHFYQIIFLIIRLLSDFIVHRLIREIIFSKSLKISHLLLYHLEFIVKI